jgi:NADH-quinone oxidoreductase subunit G
MEGYPGQPPPALIPFFWAPGWNSAQALTRFQDEVGGELRGGDPGRRLLEAVAVEKPGYFVEIPDSFAPRDGRWLVLPIHHIFGSEELSARSPAIARLAPKPYAALNPDDAAGLGLKEGEEIEVSLCGMKRRLPLRHLPSLPKGVAGIPAGIPQLEAFELPAWAKIDPAGEAKD